MKVRFILAVLYIPLILKRLWPFVWTLAWSLSDRVDAKEEWARIRWEWGRVLNR